jgi:hypothetical protein
MANSPTRRPVLGYLGPRGVLGAESGFFTGSMPQPPAVSRGGLERYRPGSVLSGGRIDLDRPASREEVGDVEGIFRVRLRRKEMACRLAADPFRDDIADVGRTSWRWSDPQGRGLVIETCGATDGPLLWTVFLT